MSVRLRLTLSYAGFLLVAGGALIALLFYVLRFVPAEQIDAGGPFVPSRTDLIEALLPRVWQVLLALAVVGLIGGWFLAQQFLPWLTFGTLWPIGLVVVGAIILVAALRRGS